MPLTVQFRNTPTSSNFPPGIVTINDNKLCDIVYVLTVTPDMYTYEAFPADANIYVEKCNLPLPNPIIRIVPDGMLIRLNMSILDSLLPKNERNRFEID